MAIHGPSIPAPAVQPRFVRGGNAPARVLTEAEVIALVGVNPPVEPLLSPAPLPSLMAAFAIRREVFGAVPMTDDGEVRALELHDVVPAGHIAVPITNARWSPHLKQGEFAIIDVSDTEPQIGELYGLMIGTVKTPKLHIVQPYRSGIFADCDGVMFAFAQRRPGSLVMADGPLMREHWHRTCRGRVVGVLALDAVEVVHV